MLIDDVLFFFQLKINRVKRKVMAETNYYGRSNRWPGGIVPYEFAPGTGMFK